MNKSLIGIALSLAVTSAPMFAASIAGSLKFLSPITYKEVTSVRVGESVRMRISASNLNLLTNKRVTLVYAISVLPTGSNTPTTISGKISGQFVLPASEGGLTKTKAEMLTWVGTKTAADLLVIPAFMPEGVATVTISLTTPTVGSINISKTLDIKL